MAGYYGSLGAGQTQQKCKLTPDMSLGLAAETWLAALVTSIKNAFGPKETAREIYWRDRVRDEIVALASGLQRAARLEKLERRR